MNSSTSSPSPSAPSGLQEPTLPEAPEVKMEVDDSADTPEFAAGAGPSTSAAAMARPSTSPGPAPEPAGSPAPGGASSSDEATANSDGEAESNATPRAVATTTGQGHRGVMDMALFFQQNHAALQQLINAGADGGNPSLALVKLFNSLNSSNGNSPGGEGAKKSRLKVFSNGYFMTFDKISSCRKKHFWRCEYKNTCKARMHTDIESEKIVTYIHDHNHSPPTPEEIELYGIDPSEIERNRVYIVGNVSDSNLRRKIRKQVADREAAARRLEQQQREELQKKQNEATMAAAHEAYARAVSLSAQPASQMAAAASLFHSAAAAVAATSSAAAAAAAGGASAVASTTSSTGAPINPHALLMAQLPQFTSMVKNETTPVYVPSYMSPNMPIATTSGVPPLVIPKPESIESSSQPSFKRRAVDANEDTEIMSHPNFEPTFQIARQLRKLWRGVPGRYPRISADPSTHFEFYIAKYDGADEHLYVPARIEHRDEANMRDALQQFSGEQCIGMLLFKVSPKISVVFNKPMLNAWDNNQFFLLDTSNPSSWRLMYVDDQAV